MSKAFKGFPITLALLVAVLGLWVFWVTRPVGWWDIARMTWVRVPEGAICSAVQRQSAYVYFGTIELKSNEDVAAFVVDNGVGGKYTGEVLHPWLKRGDISDALTDRLWADAWMLTQRTNDIAWQFVVLPQKRHVRYVVWVADETGSLPLEIKGKIKPHHCSPRRGGLW